MSYPSPSNPLAECLTALAGTPDDSSWIACQLATIAQFSATLTDAATAVITEQQW